MVQAKSWSQRREHYKLTVLTLKSKIVSVNNSFSDVRESFLLGIFDFREKNRRTSPKKITAFWEAILNFIKLITLLAVILYDLLSKSSEDKEEWTILDCLLLGKISKETRYSMLKLEYITEKKENIKYPKFEPKYKP